MKLEELFEGGTLKRQKRKQNVFYSICISFALLLLTLVLIACVEVISTISGMINSGKDEDLKADIGSTTTINIVDTKLHTGSLLILNEDNPYVGSKPKLFNIQARTDRPKIRNGKDNAYTVLRSKQNSFMATDAAASAFNKMIGAFYQATKDDNLIVSNAYDQSKTSTQNPVFSTGEAFELQYFHDYETVGASDPRSIANVELYSWIYENAYKYGFVTAGGSSSNVFRYVGVVHSTAMFKNEVNFDSYHEMLKSSTSPANPLAVKSGSTIYAIYFLKEEEKHIVPLNYSYEISGNNVDGYIITVDLTKA